MALEQTLTEWARTQGHDSLELDPDGGIQLVADGVLTIDIGPVAGEAGFSLSASVGPMPGEGRDTSMTELLMANLAGVGTGGASLALDMLRDEIVLCRIFHTDELSTAEFDRELTRFASALRFWCERLQAGRLGEAAGGSSEEAGEPAPEPAPQGPGFVRI